MRRCPCLPPPQSVQFSLLKQIPNTVGEEFLPRRGLLMPFGGECSECMWVRVHLCVSLGTISRGLGCEEGPLGAGWAAGYGVHAARFPVQGSSQALPAFATFAASFGLYGRTSPTLPLVCTLESTSSKSSLGGNNETPACPTNCFSFCSIVLTVKVSCCSRSPMSGLPTLPFPVLPPPPSGPRLSSVQGNVLHVSPLPSEQPLLSLGAT